MMEPRAAIQYFLIWETNGCGPDVKIVRFLFEHKTALKKVVQLL